MPTYLFFFLVKIQTNESKGVCREKAATTWKAWMCMSTRGCWKVRHLKFYFIKVIFKLSLDFSYLKKGIIFDLFLSHTKEREESGF